MPIEKIPTDVPGLDVLTRGGLPRQRASLLTGRSGTLKTVTAMQVACHLASAGTRVLYVCVEEEPADLQGLADDFGWGASRHVEAGTLTLLAAGLPLDGPTMLAGSFDLDGMLRRVLHLAEEHHAEVIVLDSITALLSTVPDSLALRRQVHALVHAFTAASLTVLVTAETPDDYGALGIWGIEDIVFDLVVVLRNVSEGKRRRRSIEVHKYRRSPHYKGEFPVVVTEGGLRVHPLEEPRIARTGATERYSTGLPSLDEMMRGGPYRDAILLARGPTGTGKTVLAGHLALAAAERGERVLFLGLEETRGMLGRNLASLGLSLEAHERRGTLRVDCRLPEATSPEDLIVEIREQLHHFEPALVVCDSISAMQDVLPPRSFRQFIVGLVTALRIHGRSALLTQLAVGGRPRELSYLLPMADTILLLDHDLASPHLEQSIRVLKMRGSDHDKAPRRFRIGAGGIHLDPGGETAIVEGKDLG